MFPVAAAIAALFAIVVIASSPTRVDAVATCASAASPQCPGGCTRDVPVPCPLGARDCCKVMATAPARTCYQYHDSGYLDGGSFIVPVGGSYPNCPAGFTSTGTCTKCSHYSCPFCSWDGCCYCNTMGYRRTCSRALACPRYTTGVCETCADRYYKAATGKCATCPAGHRCTGGTKAACAPGTFSTAGAAACVPCGAGTVSAVRGAALCTPCTGNTYAAHGATACLPCPATSTCAGGVTAACPAGTFTDAAHAACTPCPPGFRCAGGEKAACAPGSYQDEGARAACKPCAAAPRDHYRGGCGGARAGAVRPCTASCAAGAFLAGRCAAGATRDTAACAPCAACDAAAQVRVGCGGAGGAGRCRTVCARLGRGNATHPRDEPHFEAAPATPDRDRECRPCSDFADAAALMAANGTAPTDASRAWERVCYRAPPPPPAAPGRAVPGAFERYCRALGFAPRGRGLEAPAPCVGATAGAAALVAIGGAALLLVWARRRKRRAVGRLARLHHAEMSEIEDQLECAQNMQVNPMWGCRGDYVKEEEAAGPGASTPSSSGHGGPEADAAAIAELELQEMAASRRQDAATVKALQGELRRLKREKELGMWTAPDLARPGRKNKKNKKKGREFQALSVVSEENPCDREGWHKLTDPSSGREYWFNEQSHETSWTGPRSSSTGGGAGSQTSGGDASDGSGGQHVFLVKPYVLQGAGDNQQADV